MCDQSMLVGDDMSVQQQNTVYEARIASLSAQVDALQSHVKQQTQLIEQQKQLIETLRNIITDRVPF